MSQIQFDLPLKAPIMQSILPVMDESGMMHGFLPIAKMEFFNPVPEVHLPVATFVQPRTVTLPERPNDGTFFHMSQYVAIVYKAKEAGLRPWLGLPNFVSNDEQGYFSAYQMPAGAMINHFGRGTLLEALYSGMDTTRDSITVPPPEEALPNIINWKATVNSSTLATTTFFDFNWVTLFRKAAPAAANESVRSIRTWSNPVGGEFKASVVQGSPDIVHETPFDAIRVLRLANPVRVGTYLFNFEVFTSNGSYPCVLTLNVI